MAGNISKLWAQYHAGYLPHTAKPDGHAITETYIYKMDKWVQMGACYTYPVHCAPALLSKRG